MKKKLVLALIALAAALGGLWFHADREGARELAAMGESAREEIAREQARLGRLPRPVFEGTPRDENAADFYPALFAAVGDLDTSLPGLFDVFGPGTGTVASLTTATTAALARARPTIERIRDSLRCTRCAWPPDEREERLPSSPWISHWHLLGLLAIEGEERAEKGDLAAAAERWLETIRAESDLAGSIFGQNTDVTSSALSGLQRLLEAPPGQLDHARIARDLARLDPLLPTPREAVRWRGLSCVLYVAVLAQKDPSGALFFERWGAPPPSRLIPLHAYLARSTRELDLLYRDAARVISLDPDERRAGALELSQRADSSGSLFRRWALAALDRYEIDVRQARLRLLQAAYALEAWKDAHGHYPAPGEVTLPLDPFAPGRPLIYAPSSGAQHYTLSSADFPGILDNATPSLVPEPLRITR